MKNIYTFILLSCFTSQLSIAQHEGYSLDSWNNQLEIEEMFANHIDKTSFKKHLKKVICDSLNEKRRHCVCKPV